jgi:hypothetical protein
LTDIDGDGATDLVYVDAERVLVWINQSGMSFSSALEIFPIPLTASGTVLVADMRGVGRPGLLFSYPPGNGADQYRFLSIGEDMSPYLLTHIDNGLGAVTKIEYKSATHFQIRDRESGRPWHTFLPFPLQVVSAVEIHDKITEVTARTEYTYHEGHFEGPEREFRGFAHVEELQIGDRSVPTVIRHNFFHPGSDPSLSEADRRSLNVITRNELRALRGTLQGLKVYSLNFAEPLENALLVEEVRNRWQVRTEYNGPNGLVLFPSIAEARHIQYAADQAPKVGIVRYSDYDPYGNLLKREQIGGRGDEVFEEELYRREEYVYARDVAHPERWVVGILCRIAVFDRNGAVQSLVNQYYDGDPFVGLPFGQVERGSIKRYEELVFRDDLLPEEFRETDLSALGYHRLNDQSIGSLGWYRNKIRYNHNANNTISQVMDPLGNIANIVYDDLGIRPVRVTDAVGLITTATYDYSVESIQ